MRYIFNKTGYKSKLKFVFLHYRFSNFEKPLLKPTTFLFPTLAILYFIFVKILSNIS